MTIGKVMGVTGPAAVMGVLDGNIGKVMGETNGGGPPPGAVLEDFEGTPLVSDFTWTKDFTSIGVPITSVCTVASSTSHVTEGTKTWRLTGSISGLNPIVGIITTTTTDVSSYTNIELDVYVQAGPATGEITFGAGGGAGAGTALSATNPSGAFTLTIPVADITTGGGDPSAVYFFFYSFDAVTAGSIDFYVDNLRVS